MMIEDINLSDLPESIEEAFVVFAKEVNAEYSRQYYHEQDNMYDQNGDYLGTYEPERSYVGHITAFIDEFNLEIDVPDISSFIGHEYKNQFNIFKSKIEYISVRFALRKSRMEQGTLGTLITFQQSYKSEIGELLETIRKIVNQQIQDVNKKDKIFTKIASLQSEVDRDQTTFDAFCQRTLDLSRTIGESADLLESAIAKLERIKKIFWDKSNKVDMLPKKSRQKLLPKEPEVSEFDDEIPF